MNRQTRAVHISEIRRGNTVHHAGHDRTVSAKDLTRQPDGEIHLFGDSYKLGYAPVTLVTFTVPTARGYRIA